MENGSCGGGGGAEAFWQRVWLTLGLEGFGFRGVKDLLSTDRSHGVALSGLGARGD